MNLFQQKQKKNPKAMENNSVMIPFRVFFAFKIHFRINEEVCFWIQEFLSNTPLQLQICFQDRVCPFFLTKEKLLP